LDSTSGRKNDHLRLCINEDVGFKEKTAGFEQYDFLHYSVTEVDIRQINFASTFLGKKINFPFLISCMTGGTEEAGNINALLASAAEELKIPVGAGSQRVMLEDEIHAGSFRIIRKNAPTVPVLSNIGAAEVVKYKSPAKFRKLIDELEADALVIHINPLQELIQPEGTPYFSGLLKSIEKLVNSLDVPVIVKEVGSGISYRAAKKLLDAGVWGIDVAGAGGTSWAGVEILRKNSTAENYFWDWGLPASYCIKEVSLLKKKYKFSLIGSGGINSGIDAAKAFALGADIVASARPVLKELSKNGISGIKNLVIKWFEDISKIMFLTGSKNLKQLRGAKIIRKELFYR
jgi:isopentenyl-diphosphate delta-isomerase